MIADIDDIEGLDWLFALAPGVLGIPMVIAAVVVIIVRVRASKR